MSKYGMEVRQQFECLTTAQIAAESPIVGRKVYDTDLDRIFVGDGSTWNEIPFSVDLAEEFLTYNFLSSIKEATENTDLTDNTNTNPLGLKFSDLRYQSGRSRIEVYSIMLTDEYIDDKPTYKIAAGCGPKGFRDQVRFVGEGWDNVVLAAAGAHVQTTVSGDYVQITGLMDNIALLVAPHANAPDAVDVYVDGVDTGTNLSLVQSSGLLTYNIRPNVIISDSSISTAMSSFGLHTVKFINGDSGTDLTLNICGFELITTSAIEQAGKAFVNITENTFSKQTVTDPTLSNGMGGISYRYIDSADNTRKWVSKEPSTYSTTLSVALNSGSNSATVVDSSSFEEDDLVVVEDTSLGYTISQIFRVSSIGSATNLTFQDNAARTTQAGAAHNFAIGSTVKLYGKCGTAIDHSNEEIVRGSHPQRFGAGHVDDFQDLTSATFDDASFVLDDGMTGLWCNDAVMTNSGGQLVSQFGITIDDGNTNKLGYIFVGTGLSIEINQSNTLISDIDIYIDGVKVYDYTSNSIAERKILNIVSGLPYGSHFVQIYQMDNTAAHNSPIMVRFNEYEPIKPSALDSIDKGALITKKCFPASYLFNSGLGVDSFSKGIMYYSPNRMFKLTNSSTAWTLSGSLTSTFYKRLVGIYNSTSAVAETWFFGTGFELVVERNTDCGRATLSLDGSSDFSLKTVHQSGSAFTAASGTLDSYAAAADSYKVGVTGLTLGWHKLLITQGNSQNGSSSNFYVRISALGVIGGSACITEPTQSLQQISSCCVGDSLDLRKIKVLESEENVVNCVISKGITNAPTTTATTTVPAVDMSATITTKNGIMVNFIGRASNSTSGAHVYFSVYINGIAQSNVMAITAAANYNMLFTLPEAVFLDAGTHQVSIHWYVHTNTGTMEGLNRKLIVTELAGVKNEN